MGGPFAVTILHTFRLGPTNTLIYYFLAHVAGHFNLSLGHELHRKPCCKCNRIDEAGPGSALRFLEDVCVQIPIKTVQFTFEHQFLNVFVGDFRS